MGQSYFVPFLGTGGELFDKKSKCSFKAAFGKSSILHQQQISHAYDDDTRFSNVTLQ